MDGAQQVKGVAPVDGLPQKALGAGVVGVVHSQDQALCHDHGLLIGTGTLQRQIPGLVALNHAQAGQEGGRAAVQPSSPTRALLMGAFIRAGGIQHQSRRLGVRIHRQGQRRKLRGHDAGHVFQLFQGQRRLDV